MNVTPPTKQNTVLRSTHHSNTFEGRSSLVRNGNPPTSPRSSEEPAAAKESRHVLGALRAQPVWRSRRR